MKKISLIIFLFLISCSPNNAGFLTLVNSHAETVKITVDNRTFKLLASNHITKQMSQGLHEIKLNDEHPIQVQVLKGRTTLYDSTGLSCFVVVDFTERYSGGTISLVERFADRRFYITRDPMVSILGSYLPKKTPENMRAERIQQIDCDAINNDEELVKSFENAK